MRHILIILSILLFSSFLISCKENIQGPFTLPDGLEYVEGSKNIKKNGQGSWSYYDGRTYEGDFKDGKFNGQGTMTLKNGKKYVGDTKMGIQMVKEQKLTLMEVSMWGNSRMGNLGTERNTTKTVTS